MTNTTTPCACGFKGRRLLIAIAWAEDGNWRFLNTLRSLGATVDVLEPPLVRRSWVPDWLKRKSAAHCALYQSLVALRRGRRYDAVITWNTRTGTLLGALSRLLPRRLRPRHIVRDFHLDITSFANLTYIPRVLLVRLAAPAVDFFLTTSTQEVDLYERMFRIDPRRIRFFPDTAGGAYMDTDPPPVGDAVFAYGNSDRDFDTLLLAAPDIDRPVVVLSQQYRPSVPVPPNVTIIDHWLPRSELIAHIARAAVVVVPIKSRFIAAGQNSMLEVMSLARPLVVTSALATVDHATDGREVLFCPPRDPKALAEAVTTLLARPEWGKSLGETARQTALGFPEQQVAILGEVLAWLDGQACEHNASPTAQSR